MRTRPPLQHVSAPPAPSAWPLTLAVALGTLCAWIAVVIGEVWP